MTSARALTDVLPEGAIADVGDRERWSSLGEVPEACVSPESAEEAAAVLAWASQEGVGVVPAGSGRRLGPRRMSGRFVVLNSDRMSGIEIYEPADVTFTAKAGTPMRSIDSALRANSQWLPFDPPEVMARTLGGTVASGASGPLSMGYGAIRNHVLGATVATGDGRVLRLGGRVVKNVAGFDLLKLLVGGRGRLAYVTSVCMRAFPEPDAERVLARKADGLAALVAPALAVGTAPVMPAASVLSAEGAGGSARLEVRLHGALETIDADQRTLETHVGSDFEVSEESTTTSGTATGAEGTVVVASVLPSRLAEAVAALEAVGPMRATIDTYTARIRAELSELDADAIRTFRKKLERLGGALVVERAPDGADVGDLSSAPSPAERALGARIATAFDPTGVLWRGCAT